MLSIMCTISTSRLTSTFSSSGGGGAWAGERIPLGTAAPGQLWWPDRCLCCTHIAMSSWLSGCRFGFSSLLVITCRAIE